MTADATAGRSPLVSVLTAVHDPEPEHLTACLASVLAQTLADHEHILVDDGSQRPEVSEILDACAARPGVTVIRRSESGGIVAASRAALAAARGTFVALLDHDDVIEPHALEAMLDALGDDHDIAYSDHDLLRADGRRATPFFKPDFSPERLRSQNYITHFLIARRSLVERAGGFAEGYDGAQDHDLLLRMTELSDAVVHVPQVLYHWRQAATSVSSSSTKPWAFEAGRRAVADHLARLDVAAEVRETDHEGCYRVVRELVDEPLVSVVIPTRGSQGREWGATRVYAVDAVRSLRENSRYQNLEFVVVADTDTPTPVRRALRDVAGDALRLVEFEGPFNFSEKMNVGALAASGELLLLLNDDTELIEPRSVDVLVAHLQAPDVAMASGKLLYADGTLQHGGHVYNHSVNHALLGWPGDSPGPAPLLPLAVERECSGVTAAAALVRASVFAEVGGFTPDLPLNYNDVDFCLKVRDAGHRIIWTPWATWYHFESRTRHSVLLDEEYQFVNQRWHFEINNDPYYNPNLEPDRADWLERPFRSGAPALEPTAGLVKKTVDGVRRVLP